VGDGPHHHPRDPGGHPGPRRPAGGGGPDPAGGDPADRRRPVADPLEKARSFYPLSMVVSKGVAGKLFS